MVDFLDRVRVFVTSTGTSTASVGGVYSQKFLTPEEAGAVDGVAYRWVIEQGNDFEEVIGVWDASARSFSRSVVISKIGGVVSTNKITLNGTAQAFITCATADLMNPAKNGADFADRTATRGNIGVISPPQGRLTLTSGTAVMHASLAAATTIYFTPAGGNQCPIFDGTKFVMTAFSELSQATTDTTKSPAAVAASKNYDLFVWNDSGTIRCTRGPTWDSGAVAGSDTARGTGAGSTELIWVNGMPLNKNSITNGPEAQRGTYIGTIRSNASSTVDFIFGTIASGWGGASFGIWNAFNRADVETFLGDTSGVWSYAVNDVWRAPNGSAAARVRFVRGLDQDAVSAEHYGIVSAGAGGATVGVGLDSTSASVSLSPYIAPSATGSPVAKYCGFPGLGSHFLSALEASVGSGTSSFFGKTGQLQAGMTARVTL